jgi:hypothetical protein
VGIPQFLSYLWISVSLSVCDYLSLLYVSLVVCPIDLVISERWGMSFFDLGQNFFLFFFTTLGNVASKNIKGDKQMYSMLVWIVASLSLIL